MRQRRPFAAGLTVAAVILVIVGAATLVFDAGAGGDGGVPSPGGSATGSAAPASQAISPLLSSSAVAVSPRSSGSGASASASASVAPSTEVSPSPSANLAAFVRTSNGIVWRGSDGTIVPVPEVAGLAAQLQSGRVIFYAAPSNKYGLKNGSYAGEFMPLVTMGREDGSSAQTGGLALAGPVVARMVNDALAAAPEADRWIVALPVDIRQSARTQVSVSFDRHGLTGWSNTPRVVVRFSGTLPVVEAVPANNGFHVLVEGLGGPRWQVIDPLRLTLPTDAIDPAHAMNELLIYGSGVPSVARDTFFDVRAAMGSVIVHVNGEVSVSLVVPGSRADLGPDKVLTVGDVPVFVASS
jgi:hypothetical protein